MTEAKPQARWGTGRTEAFSDGVFAIAITLLVLELSVPETQREDLWKGIADQWPSYLGYATSFLTIGGIWLSHHAMFSRLRFVSRRLVQLNLLLLMTVSFLPFPTKLVAESISEASVERPAVVFYGLVLLAISAVLAAMWRAVAVSPDLLDDEVDGAEVSRIALAATPSMGFYTAVIALALVAPQLAAFGYLVIAIIAVVTARGEDVAAGESRHRSRRRSRRRGGGSDGSDQGDGYPGEAEPG